MQMAPFSCHNLVSYSPDFAAYLPCLSPSGPSLPSSLQQAEDQAISPSCFLCCNQHSEAASDIFPVEVLMLNSGTDSISANTAIPTAESSSSLESGRIVSFGANKITSGPSSSVQRSQAAFSRIQQSTQKRKGRQTCVSSSANSKDVRDAKSRKPKKRSSTTGAAKEAEERKEPRETPAVGYIHVRARRGEATDSHSLAERVRREKIREKMKTLQDLVPGCDKVVGKALLLEEIINYVRSLQNQVQFLSMKRASMDPNFHDVGLGFLDYLILQEELENISLGLPVVQGTGHTQPMAPADAANEDPVHDPSVPILLHEEEEASPAATFPRITSMETAPWELWPIA